MDILVNIMDAVEILSTGNAIDFGDLTSATTHRPLVPTVTEVYNHVRISFSGFRDEFGSSGPDLVGLTTMTSPYYFVPPSGSTAERPSSPPPGMLRFNTDIGRLEVWRNDHWATILGESPNLGDQNNSNSTGGTGVRGVFAGGFKGHPSPALTDEIRYIIC